MVKKYETVLVYKDTHTLLVELKAKTGVPVIKIIQRAVELYQSIQMYDSIADWCKDQATKEQS